MLNEINTEIIERYVRMQSDDVSVAELEEHKVWMSQSQANRDAYSEIEKEMSELDNLGSWARAELAQLENSFLSEKKRKFIRWPVFNFVAMAATITAVVLLWPVISKVDTQEYQTMEGEQRKIVLHDDSRIHLNSVSSARVRFSRDERVVHLLDGEALFDVAHEEGRPFVVMVRDRKIVAIGTSFNVHYKKDEVDITVVEGRVAILPESSPTKSVILDTSLESKNTTILLEPNQQIRVDIDGTLSEQKTVDAEDITAWNRGLLIFDGTPLRKVAEEISRYIVGEIQVADEVLDYPVTGVIKIRDQDTMLRLLSEVVPIMPVRQTRQLTMIFPSEKEIGSSSKL